MQHKKGRFLLFFLCFCFVVFCVPVQAQDTTYEVEEAQLVLEIPEDLLVLTPTTSLLDETWMLAGIQDPSSKLKEYKQTGMLVNFISVGGTDNIYVSRQTSTQASEIYNISLLSEEEQEQFREELSVWSEETDPDTVEISVIRYEGNGQLPYFYREIRQTMDDGSYYNDVCYITVANGYIYLFEMISQNTMISSEQKELLASVVDRAHFSELTEKPEYDGTSGLILLAGLLALILFLVLFFPLRRRRQKKQRALMVERLAKYHQENREQEQKNPGAPEPPELFHNVTVHSDTQLRKFSNFQAYRRNLLMIPMCLLTAAACFFMIFQIDIENNLFAFLLFLAGGVYMIVYLFISPNSFYKTLFRMYKVMPSRTAIFSFREKDFRISGLQAVGVYPYFQITAAYETGKIFYLYFGRDNAYFVDKNGFSKGEVKEFRAFLKQKIGSRYHRR